MKFAEWLKERRLDARLTQREAAERAGMTRAMWAKLEAGESGTRRANIPRIAEALGTDVNETYLQAGFAPQFSEEELAGIYALANAKSGKVSISGNGQRFMAAAPDLARLLIEMREEHRRDMNAIQEQLQELYRQIERSH